MYQEMPDYQLHLIMCACVCISALNFKNQVLVIDVF